MTPDGILLPTWLSAEGTQCTAAGSWVLRDRTEPSWLFKSAALEGACKALSAIVAADGNAAVTWVIANQDYSQTFVNGAWAPGERMNSSRGTRALYSSTVFAHEGATMTTLARAQGGTTGTNAWVADVGARRGDWQPTSRKGTVLGPLHLADGGGRCERVWFRGLDGHPDLGYERLGVRPNIASLGRGASRPPGSKITGSGTKRSARPAIAAAPGGDALVVFGGRLADERWLNSSRYEPGVGWQSEPTTLFHDPSIEPLDDEPALVFDGETFVAAWTAASDGTYAAFTARYDLGNDGWQVEAPHVTPAAESALLMPRLGADARGNLLLVWALAGTPTKLAYQRYRADSREWGEVHRIADVALAGPTAETVGKLPFALAPSSTGGLLFKQVESGTETLKLAQFF